MVPQRVGAGRGLAGCTLFMIVMSFFFLGPFLMGTAQQHEGQSQRVSAPADPDSADHCQPTSGGRTTWACRARGDGWNGGLKPGNSVKFDVTRAVDPKDAPQTRAHHRAVSCTSRPVWWRSRKQAQAKDYTTAEGGTQRPGRSGDKRSYHVDRRLSAADGGRPASIVRAEAGRGPTGQRPQGHSVPSGEDGARSRSTRPEAQGQTVRPSGETQVVDSSSRAGDQVLTCEGPVFERLPRWKSTCCAGRCIVDSTLPPSDKQNFDRSLRVPQHHPRHPRLHLQQLPPRVQRNPPTPGHRAQPVLLSWVLNSFAVRLSAKVASSAVVVLLAGGLRAGPAALPRQEPDLFCAGRAVRADGAGRRSTFISNYVLLKRPAPAEHLGPAGVNGLVAAGGVFLMKQFFEGMPKELEESASIDGASALHDLLESHAAAGWLRR